MTTACRLFHSSTHRRAGKCLFQTRRFSAQHVQPRTTLQTFTHAKQAKFQHTVVLGYAWSQLISVCNSERIIKIGQYLRKLCSNEKWSSFWLTVHILTTTRCRKEAARCFVSVISFTTIRRLQVLLQI